MKGNPLVKHTSFIATAATVSPNLIGTESVLCAFLLSKTEHTTSTRIEVTKNSASRPCSDVISGFTVLTHIAQQVPFGLRSWRTRSGVIACIKKSVMCSLWDDRLMVQYKTYVYRIQCDWFYLDTQLVSLKDSWMYPNLLSIEHYGVTVTF
jgi:hypothetical protein